MPAMFLSRNLGRRLAGALLVASTSARAQFGGGGAPSTEDTFLVLVLPWLLLLGAIAALCAFKRTRPHVGRAVWRTLKAWFALVAGSFVLLMLCKAGLPEGHDGPVMFFGILAMMGVFFAGIVLSVIFAVAMAVGLLRKSRAAPDEVGEVA